jgi:parvulin-like peptidyl-prolyl isomerase
MHTAVLQIMKRSNFTVPDKIVDREMAKRPEFQEYGRFSQTLYRQVSESRRLSTRRQEQERLTSAMFSSDLNNLLMSENEAKFIADMASPLRSFEMVSFRVDNFPDSEYLSFAQENSALFNSIHMSSITVASEREARRIRSSITDGTITFEDAARNHSQDFNNERGGDMGSRFLFELDGEMGILDRQTIYALRRGEISDIVEVADGWAFFRIENELVQADFNDANVMDRVRTYMRNFQRGQMEDWAIDRANEFIADALEEGFDNAARWHNLERHNFGPLPVNFGNLEIFPTLDSFSISGFSQQELGFLARNENFWKTAFSAPVNSPSQPLVQGNNVFVFLPTEETEADEFTTENITMIYTWLINNIPELLLQQYFIHSDKMDDRFWEFYFNNLMR